MRLYIILDRVLLHLVLRMETRDSDQKLNPLGQRTKRRPDLKALVLTFQARKDYICQKGVVVQFMLKFSGWRRLALGAFVFYRIC